MRRPSKVLIILFLLLPLTSFAMDKLPVNRLNIRFYPDLHKVTGVSEISLPAGIPAELDLAGTTVISASINGAAIIIDPGMTKLTFQPSSAEDVVKIGFETVFPSGPEKDSDRNPGVVEDNSIGPSGISLTSGWYPAVKGLSFSQLTATLPSGFEGISEADVISVKENPDGSREFSFSFPYPTGNINFVAGRYAEEMETFKGIDIHAYLFPDDAGLAKTYIEHAKKYLDMYEDLLGKYQYRRFSIVENILPTGYSMPTFTLLGRDVVRLPFIVDTSLGHEILHQWFGNLVYVDYTKGNWSEGLTTYLADQRFEEMKGKGADYRKQIMTGYQSYVVPGNDFPLASFTTRTDRATGAVGYGKAAMVFHMLKNILGEEKFRDALRLFVEKNRFRPASWGDIRTTFETVSGKDLDRFFSQWIDRKGEPDIGIKNIGLNYKGSKAVVSFDAVQEGEAYRIELPVLIRSREGDIRKTVEIGKSTETVEIETEGAPLELVIDDNYDLFRRLSSREFPPVISRLLGDDKRMLVIPEGQEKEYSALSAYLRGEGFTEKKEGDITYEDMKTFSLVIPGSGTAVARRLFADIEKTEGDFSIAVRQNPFNKKGVIALIEGEPSQMPSYMRKATHYGNFSRLSFKDGKNILKTTEKSGDGIASQISEEVPGIETKTIINIPEIAEKTAGKKILYVGEVHDRFEHHRVEFDIIREMHKKNSRLAIGMEMFQKPFQKALDDYIAGTIDEREFLKKSEYFKRWGYDYTLYREILLYAREYRIPVIALNIRKEIVSKVAREGISSLTREELKEVPVDMDLSDASYKARLGTFFGRHKNSSERNFDFFYEAQVLWDESMAHSLNEFMQKNPDTTVVVLAGVGHMAYGSGIPKRAYRLNKEGYSIVLNAEDDVDKKIGDFLLFPEAINPPASPKLMVQLKEEKGKVVISDFPPESISEEAGMKEGDVIISVDGTKIGDIDDLKILLLYKKKGDMVTVTVMRKKLFGPSELKFTITL